MTSTPHDALFKAAFGPPEHAAGLMRTILPSTVSQVLRWDTLAPEPGSFVDPKLGQRHTDLLFSVQLDRARCGCDERAYPYLLLEHRSTGDIDIPLRLHEYVIRICKYLRSEGVRGRLPLIIPMVIAHAPGGWTAPRCYDDMFNPDPTSIPGLAEFVPRCTLLLEDLSATSNEQLKRKAIAAFPTLALWLLRDARDAGTLFANLGEWTAVFREAILTPNGVEAVGLLLRYIALVCDDRYEEFHEKLCKELPEAEDAVMTIAEQLIQKGRLEMLEQMLEQMLVCKFRQVPPEYMTRLKEVAEDQRELWVERILAAKTLAEVFGEPGPT